MSYFRHGDPLDDFNHYDIEMERRRARRPVCSNCGHNIQDEEAYLIDGNFICQKCMEDDFKVLVDDFLDE